MIFLTILGAILFILGSSLNSYIIKSSNMDLIDRPRAFYDPVEILIWKIVSYIITIGGIIIIYVNYPEVAIFIFVWWCIKKTIKFLFKGNKPKLDSPFISNLNFNIQNIDEKLLSSLDTDDKNYENKFEENDSNSYWNEKNQRT